MSNASCRARSSFWRPCASFVCSSASLASLQVALSCFMCSVWLASFASPPAAPRDPAASIGAAATPVAPAAPKHLVASIWPSSYAAGATDAGPRDAPRGFVALLDEHADTSSSPLSCFRLCLGRGCGLGWALGLASSGWRETVASRLPFTSQAVRDGMCGSEPITCDLEDADEGAASACRSMTSKWSSPPSCLPVSPNAFPGLLRHVATAWPAPTRPTPNPPADREARSGPCRRLWLRWVGGSTAEGGATRGGEVVLGGGGRMRGLLMEGDRPRR
mmetsp:Transcript_61844/g.122276  ORF Transcript_61844/g.122276 Transcript_61844/m.122276 type:complete len:275 (-) Transcript_61844:211-1035(-)